MGGIDLFDKTRGHYRVRFRSWKWYWSLFRFCLNGSIVNLWVLFRSIPISISLLEFTRQIVIALIAAPDLENSRGIRPKTKKQVPQVVGYNLITEITLSIKLKPNDDVQIAANVPNLFASNAI